MRKDSTAEYIGLGAGTIAISILKSLGVAIFLDYFFYRSLWALLITLPLGAVFLRAKLKECYEKECLKAENEFKELLILTGTGLRAGYSVENALLGSMEDIRKLFGDKSPVYRIIQRIKVANNNNTSIANVFVNAGKSMRIKSIEEFGNVFAIAYEKSGNMTFVMDRCVITTVEKLDAMRKIREALAERTLEMKVMCIMPFAIMGYIELTSRGYFDVMYQSLIGRIIMTACLLVYIFAYVWSAKLMRIEV